MTSTQTVSQQQQSPRAQDQSAGDRVQTPSQQITLEVMLWPGVTSGTGRRGEFAFKVGGHEIGHLHGDHSAHFLFPNEVGLSLKEQGRVVDHPVFPGKPGPSARRISSQEDVQVVIDLMRFNYDRIVARYNVPADDPHSGEQG